MERVILNVAIGPHVHDGSRTSNIMNGYLLALAPAIVFGVVRYGRAAFATLALATGAAVILEWLARRIMHRNETLHDLSALVQGLLLGLLLPAGTPWWIVILGAFFMIIIGKQLYGGIGCYPFNPVLVAYTILFVSWPEMLSAHYTLASAEIPGSPFEPLAALKTLGPSVTEAFPPLQLLLGHQAGGIGTGAGLLLIIGGLYLLIRGFIAWEVAVSSIAGLYLTAFFFHTAAPDKYADPLFMLLSGMTLFTLLFLASDYTTTPVNTVARLIFGAGIGIMTVLIRNIGAYSDGVFFAVLLFNLFHPLIDRIHKPVTGLDVAALRAAEEGLE